jgi:hypothetical protein
VTCGKIPKKKVTCGKRSGTERKAAELWYDDVSGVLPRSDSFNERISHGNPVSMETGGNHETLMF